MSSTATRKLYEQDDKLTAGGLYQEIVRPFGFAIFSILVLFPIMLTTFVGLMVNYIGLAFYPPCWMFGLLGFFIC